MHGRSPCSVGTDQMQHFVKKSCGSSLQLSRQSLSWQAGCGLVLCLQCLTVPVLSPACQLWPLHHCVYFQWSPILPPLSLWPSRLVNFVPEMPVWVAVPKGAFSSPVPLFPSVPEHAYHAYHLYLNSHCAQCFPHPCCCSSASHRPHNVASGMILVLRGWQHCPDFHSSRNKAASAAQPGGFGTSQCAQCCQCSGLRRQWAFLG